MPRNYTPKPGAKRYILNLFKSLEENQLEKYFQCPKSKNMGDKGSPWILCSSKKFPGKLYYFNTRTGEKGWTLSSGMNSKNGSQKMNELKNMDPGEDAPMSNNSHVNNTQSGSNLPNTTLPSTHLDPNRVDLPDQTRLNMAQNKQYNNKSSNPQKLPIIQRLSQGQANLLAETNLPMNETNFIGNTRMSNELVLNETTVTGNTQMNKESLLNKPILWRQRKRFYSDSEDSSSPSLNMEKRREVSFSQQKRLCTEHGFQFTSNMLNEVPLNSSFSLRHAKPLKHLNNLSWKFSPAMNGPVTSQAKYKPIQSNPFSSKIKHVNQKNTCFKFGQIIQNSTDDAQMNIDNNSQLPINNQKLMSDNVKVDFKYLRRNAAPKNITEWWLVADVDVLLENFDFVKEFVAQDPTCYIMCPAAVSRVLCLMPDDCGAGDGRAAVAEQVLHWLAAHAVCEVNEDVYPLEETVIHEQIVMSCVKAQIQHSDINLMLVTKNEQLKHAAKLNDIHASDLSELKIQQKTVENNNATKRYEHIEIQINNNGQRIVVNNENRKKFVKKCENSKSRLRAQRKVNKAITEWISSGLYYGNVTDSSESSEMQ